MFKKYYCLSCGYKGKAKKFSKGSLLIEIALWLCFGIPGLIYSFWRITSKYKGCKKCRSTNIIPSDSPLAKEKSK